LILTPLARFYQEYWDNLIKLSYPHDLISLGFIIPKGIEGNEAYRQLRERIEKTQAPTNKNRFASITIERQDDEPPVAQSESERHALAHQKERRAAMSRARNNLLFTTLGPTTSWVLWLDSDIIETPPSLIQDLASHDKEIIVPNCFQRYYNKEKNAQDIRPYDFNSWQDSPTAQGLAEKMGPDEILLEGYAEMATYRTLMAYVGGMSQNFQPQSRGKKTPSRNNGVTNQSLRRRQRQPQAHHRPRRRRRHRPARQSRRPPRRRHVPTFPLLPPHRDRGLR
jgi:mannan polymerase complexes MNN9 subunit